MYSLHGLYLITDPVLCGKGIVDKVEQAILGGAQIIQYRNKRADVQTLIFEASALQSLCRQYQRTFLVNDNVSLARRVDADGVHLGQTDSDIVAARKALGAEKIIGVTCHSDIKLAKIAQDCSANYVAFGRFFPSKTKPAAPVAEIDILYQAKSQLHIPIVAIGGISVENAASLVKTGTDMLAVIHAILAQDNIKRAAAEFSQFFKA